MEWLWHSQDYAFSTTNYLKKLEKSNNSDIIIIVIEESDLRESSFALSLFMLFNTSKLNKEAFMSKHTDYEKRTEELITPILDEMGFELYDVEYVKEGADYYLRDYIDKEGGITIDDCVEVSRRMNDLLDAEPDIGGNDGYIFEVSSPGLGRVLKKDKHLEKAIGEDVDIKTYKPVNGSKEFTGTLKAFDKDTVTIEFDDGTEVFNRSDVAQIKLTIDF